MHSYLEHDMKRARQCLQNPFSQMMNQNFDGEFRAFLFYDAHNIYVISFGLYHMNHIIWAISIWPSIFEKQRP